MNCIFVEGKVVDDNGDVHFEKIETHIDKLDEEIRDIAKNFLANCKNIQGSDPCERAFSVHKCWKMHDPKVSPVLLKLLHCTYRTSFFLIFSITSWFRSRISMCTSGKRSQSEVDCYFEF